MTALAFFSGQSLMHALGWSLLHFCWQGTIIAVLLACALVLLAGRSPQTRYVAACFALVLMIVLPLATFARLATMSPASEAAFTNLAVERDSARSLQSGLEGTTEPWLDQVAGTLDRAMPWVLGVWLAGAIFLLVRLNLGLMAVQKMKSATAETVPLELQRQFHELRQRLCIARPVRLISSAVVQVPTVIGWFRPVVLMPIGCLTGLSTIQVEAILAHELAHIRRHDYLVSVLQSSAEAVLFYHPAVWWVSKQIRREREHCCDDVAVKISGNSLAYAKALSFLEEHRASLPMVALGVNGGVLAMRIRRLLGRKEAPAVSRLAALTLLAAVVAVAGLCISTAARAEANAGKQQAILKTATQTIPPIYQKWVDEDVVWIITPQERVEYDKLANNDERDAFIKQFWERRNPTPGAAVNAFKQEHYRRIAYVNQHFAAGVPGWETDRGRIFISFGRPDSIDSHPVASGSEKPYETWHYRTLNEIQSKQDSADDKVASAIKSGLDLKFVDVCSCGDYRLQPAR